VERIQFVGRAKTLGFSLQEIRELLHVQDMKGPACLNVKMLLTEKLVSVREKSRNLQSWKGRSPLRSEGANTH